MLSIGIAAVAFTTAMIKIDPNVWKHVDRGNYLVVFTLFEILLEIQSFFWLTTVRAQDNGFCQRLVCIVIDKVHLV